MAKAIKKKAAKKSTPGNKARVTKTVRVVREMPKKKTIQETVSISGIKKQFESALKNKLGDLLLKREVEKTKTGKKKLTKEIAAVKKQLRNIG